MQTRLPIARPLGTVLLRLLLLRLFLPTLILITLTLGSIGLLRQQTLARQQLKLSRSIANTVSTFTEGAKRALEVLARSVATADSHHLSIILAATQSAYGYFDTLYAIDADGRLVRMMPADPRYTGLDLRNQPYYREARQQRTTVVSAPFISMRTGKPTVYMAKSLDSGQMVVGELNLGTLQVTIDAAIGKDRENVVFVADRTGSLLAHTEQERVDEQQSFGGLDIVIRGLAAESTMAYRTPSGWVFGAAVPLAPLPWVVVSQQSLKSALAPLVNVFIPALSLSFLLWVWVVAALRRQLLKRVVAPVGRLAATAQRIAAGSLTERAHAEESREFADLAAAFNHMTGQLHRHIEMENLVAAISRRLLGIHSGQLDAAITRSLGELGGFVAADRCCLFMLADDGQTMSNTHEWCADGITPSIGNLQSLPVADHPWLMQKTARGEDIVAPRAGDVPRASADGKANWPHPGIQSLICVPILSEGALKGFVGFDAVHQERRWTGKEANLLRLAGEIFYIAMQRRRSETAVKASETRFRTLVEHAADAIFLSDLKGNLVDVNHQACVSLGYSREDLLTRHVTDIDVDHDSQASIEERWAELTPGRPLAFESRHRRKDGSIFPVMLSIGLLEIDDDRFILGLAHDITQRKRIEADLRDSEARYRQIVQHAPAGIYELDIQRMRFLNVNEVMLAFTGYSEAELLVIDPLTILTGDGPARFVRQLESLGPDHPTLPTDEYRIQSKDGRTLSVLVNTNVEFEDETPVKLTAVAHDVTALRQAENEKKRLEAKLVQVQKMESLGTLAGGIAHDFNNLLMGIQGNASLMLLDEDRGRDDREHLDNIEHLIRRGVELTRQLLGLARGGKYEVKSTDLNRLVDESAAMFSRTRKEVRIHHSRQEPIWSVECDRGQIGQVLLNIFINAWQAMPSGGDLTIATANVVLDDDVVKPHGLPAGRYVRIAISDTGTGMTPETMTKIFDPFFTTKERSRGTGLGLASAYGIVKNHDGIIDVSSRVGEGSTFTIYLPAVDKAVSVETTPDTALCLGSGCILLVDDEATVLEVGRKMLEALGYRVVPAESGTAALEIFEQAQAPFDLVVLDMIMPDMSGAETFKRLKARDPRIRVLLSSGYSLDDQAKEILDGGCRGFIQKPFTIQTLSRRVRDALDEGPSR